MCQRPRPGVSIEISVNSEKSAQFLSLVLLTWKWIMGSLRKIFKFSDARWFLGVHRDMKFITFYRTALTLVLSDFVRA